MWNGGESVLHRCRRRAASQQNWQVFPSERSKVSPRCSLFGEEGFGKGWLGAAGVGGSHIHRNYGLAVTGPLVARRGKKKEKRKIKCRRFLPVRRTWALHFVLCFKSAAELRIKYSLSNDAERHIHQRETMPALVTERWMLWHLPADNKAPPPAKKKQKTKKHQDAAQCEVSLPP